jgi:tungstate transport system substrate-binding protein
MAVTGESCASGPAAVGRPVVARWLLLCITLGPLIACKGGDGPPRLVLGTTHTLEDSGLLDALIRAYNEDHVSARVSVVVAGTGEVLAMAGRGDVDVVLVHSPVDEMAFLEAGRAVSRQPVMHNDFVILGPAPDPAGIAGVDTAAAALRRIANAAHPFVSRGDDSGTHRKEMELWALGGTMPEWDGYIEAGGGMADALRLASERRAYVLSDRATFAVLRERLQLILLHEGDARLHNQYSVLVVTDTRNPAGARAFATWLRSEPAQRLIRDYRSEGSSEGRGPALFIPDALETGRT